MGVLIFAYRKLSLKRQMNQDQFRLGQLQAEKTQVVRLIGDLQQSIAQRQDMAQQMMGNISNIFYSGAQLQMYGVNQQTQGAEAAYREALNKAKGDEKNPDVVAARNNYEAAKQASVNAQGNSMMAFNAFQTQMMGMNQQINSVFAAKEKGSLQGLKTKENRIDTEIASLNSVLVQEKADLDGVEKAETEEAKSSAPKYGLG